MSQGSRIPEVVIERLPTYVRALAALDARGVDVVSSNELGEQLGVTPAQIRKDLSNFGRFGTQGRGYDVADLLGRLRGILGLDRQWDACVVGVGRLGQALVEYAGFPQEGFRIAAAFDNDPHQVGRRVGELRVQPIEELEGTVTALGIRIAIVSVPARAAQEAIDRLVMSGITAIVNYAPTSPIVPRGVRVRQIDPVMAMESMTYYLACEDVD